MKQKPNSLFYKLSIKSLHILYFIVIVFFLTILVLSTNNKGVGGCVMLCTKIDNSRHYYDSKIKELPPRLRNYHQD